MSDFGWSGVVFVIVGLLVLASIVANSVGWHNCHQDGGTYVRAMSWTGYACIERNE